MLTVRSPRGGAGVQVGSFRPWTVREAARAAAIELGFHRDGLYTLAEKSGAVLRYEAPAPESGVYMLIDVGGQV